MGNTPSLQNVLANGKYTGLCLIVLANGNFGVIKNQKITKNTRAAANYRLKITKNNNLNF